MSILGFRNSSRKKKGNLAFCFVRVGAIFAVICLKDIEQQRERTPLEISKTGFANLIILGFVVVQWVC